MKFENVAVNKVFFVDILAHSYLQIKKLQFRDVASKRQKFKDFTLPTRSSEEKISLKIIFRPLTHSHTFPNF